MLLAARARQAQGRIEQSVPGLDVPADHHVLKDGHVAKQAQALKGARQAQARDGVRLEPIEQVAVQVNGAARGRQHARDQVKDSRLAGAIGADQGHDLTRHDVKADVKYGHQAAKLFAQVLDL